jgi:hypothetical protein
VLAGQLPLLLLSVLLLLRVLLLLTRPAVQQHDVALARLLLNFEGRLALLQTVDEKWMWTAKDVDRFGSMSSRRAPLTTASMHGRAAACGWRSPHSLLFI